MRDPIADLKHELLAAAERQQRHAAAVGAGRRRLRVSLSRNRLLLTAATVAVAAATALFFTAPWKTRRGFSGERRRRSRRPPGSILHMKWELTPTSTDPTCTVTHGPNEIWIDQTAPHRYRVLLTILRRRRSARARVLGEAASSWDVRSVARRLLRPRKPADPQVRAAEHAERQHGAVVYPVDPVKDLRERSAQDAHMMRARRNLTGARSRRIRIDPPSGCPDPSGCPRKPIYAYVDPETFFRSKSSARTAESSLYPANPSCDFHMVTRYLTFELLPRTDENLALTDIRAQHPDATESTEPGFCPRWRSRCEDGARGEGGEGARVTFEVTATADDGGGASVSCRPRSGSRFPLGKTFVQCRRRTPSAAPPRRSSR